MVAHLRASDRYHELLFSLLHKNSDIFKLGRDELPKDAKFQIYQMFDLFSEIYELQKHQTEVGRHSWVRWEQRMNALLEKRAFIAAWNLQAKDHTRLYSADFCKFVRMAQANKASKDLAAA